MSLIRYINSTFTNEEVVILKQLAAANANPNTLMVFDGNSLFSNTTTSQDMTGTDVPAKVAQYFGSTNKTYYNFGLNGQTTSQMSTDVSTQIDSLYSASTYGKNLLFVWEVTNELASGISATTAFNNLKSYCLARKAIGWKVIVLTVLPRTSLFTNGVTSGTFETARVSVNGMILSQWKDFSDMIVDAGSLNGLVYTDGTHPDTASRTIIANAIDENVNNLSAGTLSYISYGPSLTADDGANTLTAFHILGNSEIQVSVNNGAYSTYTGPISVGDVDLTSGYYKFKIQAGTNRLASSVVNSPSFAASTPGVDTDAQAYFDALAISTDLTLTDSSTITPAATLTAIDRLIKDLKGVTNSNYTTIDVWAKIKILRLNIGSTAARCKYNAKDPRDLDAAYRATYPAGNPLFNAYGMQTDGSINYEDSKFLANSLTVNNFSVFAYSNEEYVSNGVMFGAGSSSTTNLIRLYPKYGDGNAYFNAGGNTEHQVANTTSKGLFMLTSYNSGGDRIRLRLNATQLYDAADTKSSLPALDIYFSSYNNNGTSSGIRVIRNAIHGIATAFTATEEVAVYNAFLAFNTTFKRQ